jgi:hypothetical protein
MIQAAEQMGIALLSTELAMFPACGILYEAGLAGGKAVE